MRRRTVEERGDSTRKDLSAVSTAVSALVGVRVLSGLGSGGSGGGRRRGGCVGGGLGRSCAGVEVSMEGGGGPERRGRTGSSGGGGGRSSGIGSGLGRSCSDIALTSNQRFFL